MEKINTRIPTIFVFSSYREKAHDSREFSLENSKPRRESRITTRYIEPCRLITVLRLVQWSRFFPKWMLTMNHIFSISRLILVFHRPPPLSLLQTNTYRVCSCLSVVPNVLIFNMQYQKLEQD